MAGWAYDFYPRPPRGGRPGGFSAPSTNILFLSTPSARRATGRSALRMKRNNCISIHALREEGDLPGLRCAVGASQFLSTPSARRATVYHRQRTHHSGISIHALREEGDSLPSTTYSSFWNFYPRPPRGGRPCNIDVTKPVTLFLSTPSARRATSWCGSLRRSRTDFYPRPPRGGRQLAKWSYFISPVFLSTPSVRRATVRCAILRGHRKHFYPRPP